MPPLVPRYERPEILADTGYVSFATSRLFVRNPPITRYEIELRAFVRDAVADHEAFNDTLEDNNDTSLENDHH